jgi:hypothetical protein
MPYALLLHSRCLYAVLPSTVVYTYTVRTPSVGRVVVTKGGGFETPPLLLSKDGGGSKPTPPSSLIVEEGGGYTLPPLWTPCQEGGWVQNPLSPGHE